MAKLILLPGMDGTGDLFGPFLTAFGSEDVRIVRYPTGMSGGYSEFESCGRDALPADEPYVLLGESFSGPIAVSLAASRPPGLVGLILCCSFVRDPRPAFAGLSSLLRLLPAVAPPAAVTSWFLLGSFSTPALRAALADALEQVSPSVLRARVEAVLSMDVSEKLESIEVPTLYLRASHDRVVPRSAAQLVQRLLPSTRLVEISAPHSLLQAVPVEAATVVRDFMEEVRCSF